MGNIRFEDWIIGELGSKVKDVHSYDLIKDLPLEMLGLDSLEVLDLVLRIEDVFHIEIPTEGFDGITKVEEVRQLIEASTIFNSHK